MHGFVSDQYGKEESTRAMKPSDKKPYV